MEKRTVLALILCFLTIGLYQVFVETMIPKPVKTASRASVAAPAVSAAGAPAVELPVSAGSSETPTSFTAVNDVVVDNGSVSLAFNPKDAAVRQVAFQRFADPETKKPLRLFDLTGAGTAPLTVRVDAAGVPGTAADYTLETTEDGVRAVAQAGPVEIEKIFTLPRGSYAGSLVLRFRNTTGAPLPMRYRLSAGESFPQRNSIDGQYIEANFYEKRDGKKSDLRHVKENKAGKTLESRGPVEWLAVKDRQFSIILRPVSEGAFTGLIAGLGKDRFSGALVSPTVSVPAGGTLEHSFEFYAGPNDLATLPDALDPIVNFGKLDGIAKLLVGGLELLQKIFRNWGLAIIALTILINLLLFPFTRASYLSMKRMQLIQPQMNKLREQHKKNPEKLNREMMELYKKHKVNPFGGCLPMIAQMPVFIALYVALSKSVVLVNAGFLWIRDLSSPDRVPLPFSLPLVGNELHVLPLIMAVAMFVQQKFTQTTIEGQDPAMVAQQKMMAYTMPVLFGFIFYGMPSGLVLYWLTNTVLMTAYQLKIKNLQLSPAAK